MCKKIFVLALVIHGFTPVGLSWNLHLKLTDERVSTSIVTRTPPTINVDTSIRAASTLLESVKSNEAISILLMEVRLCLLWDEVSDRPESYV